MKAILYIFLILTSTLLWAEEVKIEVNPPRPVAGEVFQVLFRVFTESDQEPAINFSPGGVEVVGKSNQGVSTRTIYANGTLTVTREVLIVYELVSNRPGTSFLRDIIVQVGDKNIRHSSVTMTILKEAEVAADVFVMADVSKKDVFLGEGIIVRYFLYSKVPVNGLDIKKYPKLNGFLKRFLQEPDRTERVSVRGEAYLRSQIYAAKLFPEKAGELKIDPLSISATYPTSRSNDSFGNFGASRDYKTRTLSSEAISVSVIPVPTPVPPHFTGLVGKHEFNLEANQQKLIVNEPLEIKLTISGPGALENLEAPTLVSHPGLEEFESNGDLKINDAEIATKVFDYTFLAKENLSLPSSKVVLSYLDPSNGKYVTTELSLADITVAGGTANNIQGTSAKENQNKNKTNNLQDSDLTLAGPLVKDVVTWNQYLPILNFVLLGLALLMPAGWIMNKKAQNFFKSSPSIPRPFKKGLYDFGEMARWMSPLIHRTGKSPLLIIKDSELDDATKRYFIELFQTMDQKDYSSRKDAGNFRYESTHFRKLASYIESSKNEDTSQST